MNKESIIAIVLGLLLGVAVAGGAVFVTVKGQRDRNAKMATEAPSSTISAVPTVTVLKTLQIDSPASGFLTQEATVAIKGSMSTDSLLIMQSPSKTEIKKLKTDAFEYSFPLALGENVITISAYQQGAAVPIQSKLYVYRISE